MLGWTSDCARWDMLFFLVIRVGWYSVLVLGVSSYDVEAFVLLVCSRCQWVCTILDFHFLLFRVVYEKL